MPPQDVSPGTTSRPVRRWRIPQVPPAKPQRASRVRRRAEGVICRDPPLPFSTGCSGVAKAAPLKILRPGVACPRDGKVGAPRHRISAFVRFVRIGEGEDERYVAGFSRSTTSLSATRRSSSAALPACAAIFTPHASADWDGETVDRTGAAQRRSARGHL